MKERCENDCKNSQGCTGYGSLRVAPLYRLGFLVIVCCDLATVFLEFLKILLCNSRKRMSCSVGISPLIVFHPDMYRDTIYPCEPSTSMNEN